MDLFSPKENRQVFVDDANVWLKNNKGILAIITSLPDMEEVGLEYEQWVAWVKTTCDNLASSLDDDGIIVFYQTDRKYDGQIIDKKSLITNCFTSKGYKNIYNKIALKQAPDTINLFRPTFTNLFGFSMNTKSGKATPDVFNAGTMIYKNAMGYDACKNAISFIHSKIDDVDCIVDPFCGMGSVLKISNDLGFKSVGVDILESQVILARNL